MQKFHTLGITNIGKRRWKLTSCTCCLYNENIVCLLLPLGIGTCCSASHAMQDLQAWEPISKSCIQFLEYDKQKCLKCPWNKEGIQGEKEKNKKGRRKWKLMSHTYCLYNENIVCLLLLLGTRTCCSASLTMQVLAWEPISKSCMQVCRIWWTNVSEMPMKWRRYQVEKDRNKKGRRKRKLTLHTLIAFLMRTLCDCCFLQGL
jgi:hypothetical protein